LSVDGDTTTPLRPVNVSIDLEGVLEAVRGLLRLQSCPVMLVSGFTTYRIVEGFAGRDAARIDHQYR
jgi:hypothetical protein